MANPNPARINALDAALQAPPDVDLDGVNSCDDCDGFDPAVFPGNAEICADGLDND